MLLGYILDEVENAKNYFEWHDKYIAKIKEKVSGIPEDEKITVFIDGEEGGIAEREDMSDHFTTWEPAGGKSITHIDTGQRMIETEWILDQNPDVIIGCRFDGGYKTDDESPYKAHYDEIIGLPGFEHVKAVKYGRVYVCFGRLGMGLHTPIGITYTAKWLYPDLFEDLDPQAIHQEYIDRFCPGLDFDVSVHGVFAYPKSASW
jgi:iron complex transport system substrate-binding protein